MEKVPDMYDITTRIEMVCCLMITKKVMVMIMINLKNINSSISTVALYSGHG